MMFSAKLSAKERGPSVSVIQVDSSNSMERDGAILSSLLQNPERSFVVHGISERYYDLTSGYRRSEGNYVLKFAPGSDDAAGCHFNPLDAVRVGTQYEVMDSLRLASFLTGAEDAISDYWVRSGTICLAGIILHVLYAMPDKTLRGVAAYLNGYGLESVEMAFEIMMQTIHDPDYCFGWLDGKREPTPVHPFISQVARSMLNMPDRAFSSVLSTAASFVAPYLDPIVARWTEYSDFRVADLQDADQPVTLYLLSTPSERIWIEPLLKVVLQQITSAVWERTESCSRNHPLTFLTTEPLPQFAALDTIGSCLTDKRYSTPRVRAMLCQRTRIPPLECSNWLPGARKDYEIVFGPSKGILSVPEIPKEWPSELSGKTHYGDESLPPDDFLADLDRLESEFSVMADLLGDAPKADVEPASVSAFWESPDLDNEESRSQRRREKEQLEGLLRGKGEQKVASVDMFLEDER